MAGTDGPHSHPILTGLDRSTKPAKKEPSWPLRLNEGQEILVERRRLASDLRQKLNRRKFPGMSRFVVIVDASLTSSTAVGLAALTISVGFLPRRPWAREEVPSNGEDRTRCGR